MDVTKKEETFETLGIYLIEGFIFWLESMDKKIIIIVIIVRSSPPTSARASEDDADAAFDAFTQLANNLHDDLQFETSKSLVEASQKLEEMQVEALFSLDKKITEVELSILTNWTTFENRERLTERANKCRERSLKVIDNLVRKTVTEFEMHRDDYLGCYSMSLDACKSYALNDTCFDGVIKTLKDGEDRMTRGYQMVLANMKSKLIAFKLPCQEMMEFEISFYPESILPPLSQCAENLKKNSRPLTCGENTLF